LLDLRRKLTPETNRLNKNKQIIINDDMSKSNLISKIKELFAEQKFATDYTATTGEIIRCLGSSLSEGERVVQVIGGEETSLTDGEYVLDNGKAITVLGGEIKTINDTTASETMEKTEETSGKTEDTGAIIEKMEDYKNEISAKLIDGTEVKVLTKGDALSVGDMVLVKDAEGNFVKAPEGEHKLEGGLTIYVDAEGFINELETEETEEEDTEELKKQMSEMFEAISTMKSMIDEVKSSIASVKDENKTLTEKVSKFSAEPSVESITKEKHFSKVNSKEEKLKFFSKR
jgi:hypothetical protein